MAAKRTRSWGRGVSDALPGADAAINGWGVCTPEWSVTNLMRFWFQCSNQELSRMQNRPLLLPLHKLAWGLQRG
jgi:hypothetical protein